MVTRKTDLDINKDRGEDTLNFALGAKRSNEQDGGDGVQSTRLDEHCDHGIVQSVIFDRPDGISNVLAVSDEPYCDHEREKDIERKGNRIVWYA
jgi:hypothetical protein